MTTPNRRDMLKRLIKALSASVLPAGAFIGCAMHRPPTPGDSAVSTQLEAWISGQMRKQPYANLSVALLDGDRIAWAAGFGMADPTRQQPANAHTRYRAGSISKVFTAMAALQLAEQGRLDLDAPLSRLLPNFRLRSRFVDMPPVTVRQILQHRSGLPSDHAEGMWTDSPEHFAQLVETLRDEHMAFPPGEVQSYCNVGFTLLGAAIERAVGQPFHRWLQTQWLDPMGMADSAFEIGPPVGPRAAAALDANGRVAHEPGLRDLPAGGLNSTVLDLLQLARLWFAQGHAGDRRLLSPPSLVAMQTPPQRLAPTDLVPMGLAWHLPDEELDGVGPLLWHAGGTPHHHAQLMLLPDRRLAVAVMSSAQAAGELAQTTALKALSLMVTAQTGVNPERALRQGVDPAYPPTPLTHYAGHYDTPMGVVRIEGTRRQTTVWAMGRRFRLSSNADGYAQLQFRWLGLLPVNLGRLGELAVTRHDTPDGQAWLMARRKGRFVVLGTRLDPVPIPPPWRQRLGRYRYAGNDALLARQFPSGRLTEESGLLLAELDAGPDGNRLALALAPVNDNQAIVRGIGRGRGDTVHATLEGDTWVLSTSGMRFVRQHTS